MGVVKSDLNKLLEKGVKVPAILERCVAHLVANPKFTPKDPKMSKRSAAFAVCTAQLKKAGKLTDEFKSEDQVILNEIEKIALENKAKPEPLYILPLEDSNIEVADGVNRFRKQVLRLGKWLHPKAPNGVLNVTKEFAKKLVNNFKKGVLEDVFVPFTHSDDPRDNAGHVVEMVLTKDGIDVEIEVSEKAADLINEGKVKGISACIDNEYENKETGKLIGPIIRHVALVMEPYIKGLKPYKAIALVENGNRDVLEFELEKKGGETRVVKKETKLTDVKPKSTPAKEADKDKGKKTTVTVKLEDKASEKITKLADQVKELNDKLCRKEAMTLVDEWLAKGKIVPAQKEAAIALLSVGLPTASGIELTDKETKKKVEVSAVDAFKLFVKNNPKIDLSEKGDTEADKVKGVKVDAEIKEQLDKLGLSEEDYQKFGGEKSPAEIAKMLQGEEAVGAQTIVQKK